MQTFEWDARAIYCGQMQVSILTYYAWVYGNLVFPTKTTPGKLNGYMQLPEKQAFYL